MLRVDRLSKVYEPLTGWKRVVIRSAVTSSVTAVDDVSFSAEPGEIVGLVGPNGAGKTTIIRMIADLVEPTSGRIAINSVTDGRERAGNIGLLLTDERALYWRLTGQQNLEFFGIINGLTRSRARRRAEELMVEAGLADRDRLVFGYSAGMRVQLGIARAMLHEPRVLILDEPSRSLDPIAADELQTRLRRVAERGTTIVLSSHRLNEVVDTCDRVLVITEGRSRFWGSLADLTSDRSEAATSLRSLLDTR